MGVLILFHFPFLMMNNINKTEAAVFPLCQLLSLHDDYTSPVSSDYSEIIYIRSTFNCVNFVCRSIHKYKIPMKYLFTFKLVILHIIWNPRIQVSTNMSNVVKPRNFVPTKLNDFTVLWLYLCVMSAPVPPWSRLTWTRASRTAMPPCGSSSTTSSPRPKTGWNHSKTTLHVLIAWLVWFFPPFCTLIQASKNPLDRSLQDKWLWRNVLKPAQISIHI